MKKSFTKIFFVLYAIILCFTVLTNAQVYRNSFAYNLPVGTAHKAAQSTGFLSNFLYPQQANVYPPPLPTVDNVANQTIVNGDSTTPINFTGTGNTFVWTNDKPAIGLKQADTGNIASFKPINLGKTPLTATIKVTPLIAPYAYLPTGTYDQNAAGYLNVYNTLTGSLVKAITLDKTPGSVLTSSDGNFVYAINRTTISVISTATNTSVLNFNTPSPFSSGMALSKDGGSLYITNSLNNGSVSVINTSSGALITTITVGVSPVGIVVSPDGSRVYVVNEGNGTISIIDTSTNTVIDNILAGTNLKSITISPDGSRLYVSSDNTNSLIVINTATSTVVTSILGIKTSSLAISPDGSLIYARNTGDDIAVINTATNTVSGIINVPTPGALSLNKDGSRLYVLGGFPQKLYTVNTATRKLINIRPVQSPPYPTNYNSSFVADGGIAPGIPVNFTITINPLPPSIFISNRASGNIYACAGNPSVNPNVDRMTISGLNLNSDITATAPSGFEVSLSATGGYGSSVIIAQTDGSVSDVVVYIRSAASAAGNISGNVVLTSTGAVTQNAFVSGTVTPLPAVGTVPNQTVINGDSTAAINFSGTGNTFTWVNNTPSIGLAAKGSGNIPPFKAINTGSSPVTATITATPVNASYAYISNGRDSVLKFNLITEKVEGKLNTGSQPFVIAMSPDGSRLYVTNILSNTLSVINTATYTITATITMAANPKGVVVSPDGNHVYVSNGSSKLISVINAATNTVEATIPLSYYPDKIIISPDGNKLYILDGSEGASISIVDIPTQTLVKSISIAGYGVQSFDILLSPDGNKLYATIEGNILTINTATNRIVSYASAPDMGDGNVSLISMAISKDGKLVYIGSIKSGPGFSESILWILNTQSNTLVANLRTPGHLGDMTLSTDGSKLFIPGGKSLLVINPSSITVQDTININSPAYYTLITPGLNCKGSVTNVTITINPPVIPTINANMLSGKIYACAGAATSKVQHFKTSGQALTNDITITAPDGFKISLSATGNFSSSLVLNQTGGTVPDTEIYVRSTALTAGDASGNIVLTSTGASTKNVAVSSSVNAPLAITSTIPPVNYLADTFAIPTNTITGAPDKYSITTGTRAMSGFVSLNNGIIFTSVITVKIPPQQTGTYDFNITLLNSATGCSAIIPIIVTITSPSHIASLSALTIDPATTLSPDFSSSVTSYSASVSNTTYNVKISPIKTDIGATVTINNTIVSRPYNMISFLNSVYLNSGNNKIDIIVTAEDQVTTKTYTLNVYRTKHVQIISLANMPSVKTYGDLDFPIRATSSNVDNRIDYKSDNLNVATIKDDFIHIVGAGTVNITASQPEDPNYSAAEVTKQLVVNKAGLLVTADAKSKVYGQINPALTFSYSGFVNGEDATKLLIQPTATTTATTTSDVGIYPITVDGGVSNNYTFNYTNNLLTITPAMRTITFNALANKTFGTTDFSAGATTSSGEPVIYTSSNPLVATVANGNVHITGTGSATITATVITSSNYTSVPVVSQGLFVDKASQTITFNSIASQTKGTQYSLASVTASSGLPVGFSSADPAIASIQGTTLNMLRAGTTTITASQPGNENYLAASAVTQAITVTESTAKDILISKAISPNGDGINDVLYIDGITDHPDNKVTLINPQGTKIFEIKGYDNSTRSFNGHSNISGAMQQQGTYFCLIEYTDNGTSKRKTGYFVLRY